jgi:hypothetical protein
MNDELAARHRAMTLRLAGRSVKSICPAVGRTQAWFHKWWRRYLESGAEGLFDLTRANHRARRIPPSWSGPSSPSAGASRPMPRRPPATA